MSWHLMAAFKGERRLSSAAATGRSRSRRVVDQVNLAETAAQVTTQMPWHLKAISCVPLDSPGQR